MFSIEVWYRRDIRKPEISESLKKICLFIIKQLHYIIHTSDLKPLCPLFCELSDELAKLDFVVWISSLRPLCWYFQSESVQITGNQLDWPWASNKPTVRPDSGMELDPEREQPTSLNDTTHIYKKNCERVKFLAFYVVSLTSACVQGYANEVWYICVHSLGVEERVRLYIFCSDELDETANVS